MAYIINSFLSNTIADLFRFMPTSGFCPTI